MPSLSLTREDDGEEQITDRELGMTQVQVSRRERALLLTLRKKLTG